MYAVAAVGLACSLGGCAQQFNFVPPEGKTQEEVTADYRRCEMLAQNFGSGSSSKPFTFRSSTSTYIPGSARETTYYDDSAQREEHVSNALVGMAASANQAKVLKFCLSELGYSVGNDADAD